MLRAFGGLQAKLQQMKVVVCCLDGENLVGSRKDPVFVAYIYSLKAHGETAESALSLYLHSTAAVSAPVVSLA